MITAATAPRKVFARPDTMFGICEAIGRDLGFNPDLLRIALGFSVIFSLTIPFMIYAALGVIVLISRLIAPVRGTKATAEVTALPAPVAPEAANATDERALALAA